MNKYHGNLSEPSFKGKKPTPDKKAEQPSIKSVKKKGNPGKEAY